MSELLAKTTEWRALLLEVPKLGWQRRMALALEEACDEIDSFVSGDLKERVRQAHAALAEGDDAVVAYLRGVRPGE